MAQSWESHIGGSPRSVNGVVVGARPYGRGSTFYRNGDRSTVPQVHTGQWNIQGYSLEDLSRHRGLHHKRATRLCSQSMDDTNSYQGHREDEVLESESKAKRILHTYLITWWLVLSAQAYPPSSRTWRWSVRSSLNPPRSIHFL